MKLSTRIFAIISFLIFFLSSCTQNNSNNELKKDSLASEPILLSDTSNTASCVYLTEDENGVPAISWVEIDTAKVKHFYFANWDTEKNQFKPKI